MSVYYLFLNDRISDAYESLEAAKKGAVPFIAAAGEVHIEYRSVVARTAIWNYDRALSEWARSDG